MLLYLRVPGAGNPLASGAPVLGAFEGERLLISRALTRDVNPPKGSYETRCIEMEKENKTLQEKISCVKMQLSRFAFKY